jgi:cobyrinic acid a,c-diamide synthase
MNGQGCGYDVLVIAGTTESRKVIEQLIKEGKTVLASVATELGKEMLLPYPIEICEGRRDVSGFIALIEETHPARVIDASHPFAKIVTETVKEACQKTKTPYERYEREEPDYDYDGIYRVSDAKEAAALLSQMEGNVLLTTGANTAGIYAEQVKDAKTRLYVRVLDTEKSYEACEKAGYPREHVIGTMPPYTVEDNLHLIDEYKIQIMVSKDSGTTGGVPEKVETCRQRNIPMILIDRPADKIKIPRIALAGANSGCGKTTVTCGILKALHDRNVDIQPFKCGPDYIDPMLHGHIAGKSCRNLDPFFLEEDELRDVFVKDAKKAEFSVIEGVMGYYDGMGVGHEKSTHTVTMATQTPTILILNVKGMSYTMIPLLEGLISHMENPIRGVILNRCSKGMFDLMKPVIEEKLGIAAVGYLPPSEDVVIGSRHLGLMTAGEIKNLDQVIEAVGNLAKETIDIDRLIEIGKNAPALPAPTEKKSRKPLEEVPIAIATDNAFCFYYEENLEVLRELGAKLIPFSPVNDTALPEGIGGIYLGGGYPETYEKQLSENEEMKTAIRNAVSKGMPLIAECGGFMYACDKLVETDGTIYSMANLVDTDVHMTKKLNMQFGYVTLTAKKDSVYVKKGQQIRAHEFHYSKADQTGDAFVISKQNGRHWDGVHIKDRVWAGYPHLYFRNCMEVAQNFMQMARETAGGNRA